MENLGHPCPMDSFLVIKKVIYNLHLQDDDAAMDFVASAANIRAHIFSIAEKTRFDIKCKFIYFY